VRLGAHLSVCCVVNRTRTHITFPTYLHLQFFSAKKQRVFSVLVEDTPVALSLDVYEAAGGEQNVYTLVADVTCTDRSMTIEFISEEENPMFSAVEVIYKPEPEEPGERQCGIPKVRPAGCCSFCSHVLVNVHLFTDYCCSYFSSQLLGDSWTNTRDTPESYPIDIAEGQGGMIGTDFVIASGYFGGYSSATVQTYAYDTSDPNAIWRRMDDMPVELGVTHAATVVVGEKMYIAGGYLGGNSGHGGVGQEIADVLVYDHSVSPGNGQWSTLPSLPEGRAGGGMFYDSAANALLFGAGAVRPWEANRFAIDKQETWMYSFNNPGAGWVSKADTLFHANHMSYTTAIDSFGKERHYFLAGQGKIALALLSCCDI